MIYAQVLYICTVLRTTGRITDYESFEQPSPLRALSIVPHFRKLTYSLFMIYNWILEVSHLNRPVSLNGCSSSSYCNTPIQLYRFIKAGLVSPPSSIVFSLLPLTTWFSQLHSTARFLWTLANCSSTYLSLRQRSEGLAYSTHCVTSFDDSLRQ